MSFIHFTGLVSRILICIQVRSGRLRLNLITDLVDNSSCDTGRLKDDLCVFIIVLTYSSDIGNILGAIHITRIQSFIVPWLAFGTNFLTTPVFALDDDILSTRAGIFIPSKPHLIRRSLGARGVLSFLLLNVVQLDLPNVRTGYIRACVRILHHHLGAVNPGVLTGVRHEILDLEHLSILTTLSQVRLQSLLLHSVCISWGRRVDLIFVLPMLGAGTLSIRYVPDARVKTDPCLTVRPASKWEEIVDLLFGASLSLIQWRSIVFHLLVELLLAHAAILRLRPWSAEPVAYSSYSILGSTWLSEHRSREVAFNYRYLGLITIHPHLHFSADVTGPWALSFFWVNH